MKHEYKAYDHNKTWFFSDPHFGHDNVLKFEEEFHKFKSVAEHDQQIVSNWIRQVDETDTVFFLGDASIPRVKLSYLLDIFKVLPGKIIWFRGNHDRHINIEWERQLKQVADITFTQYEEIYMLDKGEITNRPRTDGFMRKIVLFHYPILDWNEKFHGSYHLYGHSHATLHPIMNAYSVCACFTNYELVNFEWVKKKIAEHNEGLDRSRKHNI